MGVRGEAHATTKKKKRIRGDLRAIAKEMEVVDCCFFIHVPAQYQIGIGPAGPNATFLISLKVASTAP